MTKTSTQRFHFTKRALDALPLLAKGERKDYYDTIQRNLLLRVTGTGRKTFLVRRKINNVSERIVIGEFPEISVEQARKQATWILAEINKGNNPQEEKRIESEEPTLGELFQNYLEGHVQVRCLRVDEVQKDFRRYFSDWANRRVSTITRPDAQTRITALRRNHGAGGANHALVLMKAMFNWNIRHGYISGDNPWAGIKAFKARSRERFLLPEEMGRFFAALERVKNEVARDYIKLSLLTGARRSNVLSMKWEHINFELAIWRIPMTKNGESHLIPLTGPAMAILKERYEKRGDGPWVLPGDKPGAHLVEVKRVWAHLLEDAGIQDLRLHDLRRTLGSYMAIGNQSLHIIGKALGHKSTQSTQIYARLSQDPVRRALEQAHADMFTAAGLPPGDNVVPFSDGRPNVKDSSQP